MEELGTMSYHSLLALLAEQTMLYTQMLTGNIKTDEFYDRKQLVEKITAEIGSRKEAERAKAVQSSKFSAIQAE